MANGFQNLVMKEALITQEELLHLAQLEETMDLKELDMAHQVEMDLQMQDQAHQEVDHLVHQALMEVQMLVMVLQLEFQQAAAEAMDQSLHQKQLQLAVPVIKDHQDHQDQKAQLETQERMETMERMVTTERMLNLNQLNQPKFALSAHKDLKVRQEALDLKDHQGLKEAVESLRAMEAQETKVNQDNLETQEEMDVKDHVVPQAKTVDLSQLLDLKDLLDHQDNQESQDQKVNLAQMAKALKDRQVYQVMPEPQDVKEDLGQLVPLDRPVRKVRKAHASIARHHVLHQVIRTFPKSLNLPQIWLHQLFLISLHISFNQNLCIITK